MAAVTLPNEAAAPITAQAPTQVPSGQSMIPFRRAAGAVRVDASVSDTGLTPTGSQQKLTHTVPGTGYMAWLDVIGSITVASNASATTVASAEDAPWTVIGPIVINAGGGDTINLQNGFEAHLQNLYGGFGYRDASLGTDTAIYSNTVGTAATAGSLTASVRLPLVNNERELWGLMGNQSRGTKYNLRTDLGATGDVWTTAPSSAATVTAAVTRWYGYLPVPGDKSARGIAQQKVPDTYGIIHWIQSAKSEALPAAGVVNHYIRNLQNAVRLFILVFRQGTGTTPRATAEGNMPSNILLRVGSDTIFNESYQERRKIMYDHYKINAPAGVLVYDWIHDFESEAGFELGDQYLYLGDITEALFQITYPSGFTANAANSLTVITDSFSIPDSVNIYGVPGGI